MALVSAAHGRIVGAVASAQSPSRSSRAKPPAERCADSSGHSRSGRSPRSTTSTTCTGGGAWAASVRGASKRGDARARRTPATPGAPTVMRAARPAQRERSSDTSVHGALGTTSTRCSRAPSPSSSTRTRTGNGCGARLAPCGASAPSDARNTARGGSTRVTPSTVGGWNARARRGGPPRVTSLKSEATTVGVASLRARCTQSTSTTACGGAPGAGRGPVKRSSISTGERVKRSAGTGRSSTPAAPSGGSRAARVSSPSTTSATLRPVARRTRTRTDAGRSRASSSPPPWSMGTRSDSRDPTPAQESPWSVSVRSGAAP